MKRAEIITRLEEIDIKSLHFLAGWFADTYPTDPLQASLWHSVNIVKGLIADLKAEEVLAEIDTISKLSGTDGLQVTVHWPMKPSKVYPPGPVHVTVTKREVPK